MVGCGGSRGGVMTADSRQKAGSGGGGGTVGRTVDVDVVDTGVVVVVVVGGGKVEGCVLLLFLVMIG